MKNIPLARLSCILAAVVWLGLFLGVVATRQARLYLFKDPTGILLLECSFFTFLGMALLGVGLGIGGLLQAGRKKVLAVFGLILNGLIVLGGVALLYIVRQ
jgi:hypothetical protein